MDAINRFPNVSKSIFSESEETLQTQNSEQVPTAGIGSVQDSFVNSYKDILPGDAIGRKLPPLTTPMMQNSNPAESVDASSIFDLVTADLPGMAKVGSAIQVPENKWDIVEFLIKESRKSPVDSTAMVNKLVQLTPAMRHDVLAQLSNQDDLRTVMSAMAGRNESGNAAVDLLSTLTQDLKNDPQALPFFREAYDAMNSHMYTSKDTSQLKDYLNAARRNLDALPSDVLDLMQSDALRDGKMMDLSSWEILQQKKYAQKGDPDAVTKAYNDRNAKLDSINTSDPNYYRYITTYQDWGMQKLMDAQSDPQQFSTMINGMKDNVPSGLAGLLASACRSVENNEDPANLTNLIQHAVNTIQNSYDNSNWNQTADEVGVINDMVSRFGDHQQAVNTLSKLPPNILLDLSMIEQSFFGSPDVRKIIDEAMAISKMNF